MDNLKTVLGSQVAPVVGRSELSTRHGEFFYSFVEFQLGFILATAEVGGVLLMYEPRRLRWLERRCADLTPEPYLA